MTTNNIKTSSTVEIEQLIEQTQANLVYAPAALEYLKSRGVSFRQVQKYKIGYLNRWVEVDGLGKLAPNSLVFPMLNEYQELIGVVLRSLGQYGYSKHVFDKEKASKRFLYGLAQSLDSIYTHQTVLCVEGIFDLLAVEAYFPACVAMLTSRFSQEQQKVLKRYVNRVLFMPDNDPTGRSAAENATKYMGRDFALTVIPTQTKDPSGWKAQDKASFKEKMQDLKLIYL